MMFGILYFLAFIVFHGTQAQDACIPDNVVNVTLDSNYTLYWEASTNCESTNYVIYIRVEDELNDIYTTEDTFLNVSFLPACEFFYFEVRAYSGNQMSDPVLLYDYVPVSGADLTISRFNIKISIGTLYMELAVNEKYASCVRGFRIVIQDELNISSDIYIQHNNITIDNLVPCGDYHIGVMAIYNIESEGPRTNITYVHPAVKQPIPVLDSVSATDTTIDLTWSVSTYLANRCSIRSFVIDGSPYFNQTIAIEDSPERPPIAAHFASLRPDSLYYLSAYVVNSAGPSDIFQMAVHTLPTTTN